MELLTSDGWRQMLSELILPFALGDLSWAQLGDDVLEVGPGPGMTTDLLGSVLSRLTAVELDADLAAALEERMAGTNVEVVQADATSMPFDAGRFSGAVSFTMCHHVPTVELQDRLFAEVLRVLRPAGLFIANDSIASEELAALHVGDVYCPVDPDGLATRLSSVGFVEIDVRANTFAWACHARCPA